MKISEGQREALNYHVEVLERRKTYLLENGRNIYASKEAAALTYVIDLLCDAVDGWCEE